MGIRDCPRVPSAEEAAPLLRTGLEAIPAERLWVNPDCGPKTRAWPETRASLENLVAARPVREELSASRPRLPARPLVAAPAPCCILVATKS